MLKKCLSACLLSLSISLPAATLYVSTEAAQGGNGTQSNPFRQIQAALDIALPGDTVQLAPGIYRERVHFVKGGEKDRPVRLNGPREAVIDASENTEFKWQPAPEIGPNVYRTAVPQQMYTIACEEGLVIPLNEERVTLGSPKCSKSVTDHKGIKWIWDWKHNLREGVGELGWGAVKALAMYHQKSGEIFIAFGDGRDPRVSKISMTPREAAVKISGIDYCIISGITMRHAWYGVLMDGTKNSIVENCRIERSDFGVQIEGKSADCIVRNSEISMDPYCASNPWSKGSWDTWQAHKVGGFWDRIGVDIHSSLGGHKIHDNYIHNHWGGVQDRGEIGENTNLEVHHNRIHDIADDGLEPDGAEENCQWYENFVSDSRCGFRIKCVKKGPLYAYRNLFMHNREDFRNFGNPDLAKATVYVYFNTSTSPVGISTNKVPKEIGNPNYHYFNNIFYCRYPFGQTDGAADPDWQEGGNVFIRSEENPHWESSLEKAVSRNFGKNSLYLTGQEPGFQDFEHGNLALTANSPARQAGVLLDKYNLPGLEQYKGIAKPDAGALPFGTTMPKIPR